MLLDHQDSGLRFVSPAPVHALLAAASGTADRSTPSYVSSLSLFDSYYYYSSFSVLSLYCTHDRVRSDPFLLLPHVPPPLRA
jgi:hypothetical protein